MSEKCRIRDDKTGEACGMPAVKTIEVKLDLSLHFRAYQSDSSMAFVPVCEHHAEVCKIKRSTTLVER